MPGRRSQKSRSQKPEIPTGTIEVDVSGYQECLMKDHVQMMNSEAINTSPSPNQSQAKHIGPTMEIEPLLFDLVPNYALPAGRTYQKLGDTPFLFESKDRGASALVAAKMLGHIQLLAGDNVQRLVDIFETVVQPGLPVVAQEVFDQGRLRGMKLWNPVLLATVCALSQPWFVAAEKEPSIAPELEKFAFEIFHQSLDGPSLSSVQAGLLLIQLPEIDTKRINTELVDAAYGLGLNLDCSSWPITGNEKRLRKRLAWALYMQDKWCSLTHGRPSAISRSYWTVPPLSSKDFDPSDDASVNLGRDVFMHMASLTEILALILDTLYTSQALDEIHSAGEGATRMILERAKPAQMQLKKWYDGLPAHLKFEANLGDSTSSIGHLYLAYFCTEITLHRPIIRSLAACGANGRNTDAAHWQLEDICRAAAKTRLIRVLEFVNRLRPTHWGAFWYFPSSSALALVGAFGALLRASAPAREEAAFYKARLREYRWTLTASARHASFVQLAIARLDEAEALMQNLPMKPTAKELAEARCVAGEEKGGKGEKAGGSRDFMDGEGRDEDDEDEEYESEDDEDTDADMDMDVDVKSEGE